MLIAIKKITKKYNNVYLCMVGRDIGYHNEELISHINNLNITKKVILINEQKNLMKFYNGIDFLLLASHSESFPNVVAESMLCSTPVLSSDAGCAKKIIHNFGFIMKNNDHQSIFKDLKRVIYYFKYNKKKWKYIKQNSRIHIKNNFSIPNMSNSYLNSWFLK